MVSSSPDRRAVLQGLAGLAAATSSVPARAEPAAVAFVALGDWGRGGGRHQVAVARAMGEAAAQIDSRYVISVGDNFYPDGVQSTDDPQWRTSFEAVYTAPSLQTPWLAALGNHDYRGQPFAQVAYSRTSSRWRMPSRYYAVTGADAGHPDLDIFVLDTTPITGDYAEALMRLSHGRVSVPDADRQVAWLDAALGRSRAAWKVVVGHHPIHSGGHHGGSPELTRHVEPLLRAHGVQAYLFGHDHALQHIRVDGVNHICTGAGSSAGHVADVPGTRFRHAQPGFAMLALSADTLNLEFRQYDGRTVYRAPIKPA